MKIEVGKTYKSNHSGETFKIIYRYASNFLALHFYNDFNTGATFWFNELGECANFTSLSKFFGHGSAQHNYKLVPNKTKKEGWINIYPVTHHEAQIYAVKSVGAYVWKNEEEALNRGVGDVIKIEWEEDE